MNDDFKGKVIGQSLSDIKVELDDEFDQNFSRKAFFTEPWPDRKYDDQKGSLLVRSGQLRRSIRSHRRGTTLCYTSDRPYARVHNEGGKISVTKKMKGYFWYRYSQTSAKVQYKKNGERRGTKKNQELTSQEEFYRSMALKKVGDKIKIPQRKFIGISKETDRIIRDIVTENTEDYFKKNPIIKPEK